MFGQLGGGGYLPFTPTLSIALRIWALKKGLKYLGCLIESFHENPLYLPVSIFKIDGKLARAKTCFLGFPLNSCYRLQRRAIVLQNLDTERFNKMHRFLLEYTR